MRVTGLLQVFLLLTLSALGLAASLPNGRPNPDGLTVRTAPERDYTIGKMGFKGLIGGHYFELNGTIQSSHKPKSSTQVFNTTGPLQISARDPTCKLVKDYSPVYSAGPFPDSRGVRPTTMMSRTASKAYAPSTRTCATSLPDLVFVHL